MAPIYRAGFFFLEGNFGYFFKGNNFAIRDLILGGENHTWGWGLWSEMGAFANFGVGKVWAIHFLGATEIGVWGRGIVLGVSEKARHLWGRDGSLVVPET